MNAADTEFAASQHHKERLQERQHQFEAARCMSKEGASALQGRRSGAAS